MRTRAPEWEDAPAVVALLAARHTADIGVALFPRAGYSQVRSYWRMARPLDRGVPVVDPPAPVKLRPLDPDRDARDLYALDAKSFASSPDYVAESYDMFVQEHLRAHNLAPDLSFVAQDGAEAVGFVLSRRWRHEASGYVDLLAVAPDHQHRGIGTALLTHAFAAFAADGLVQAQLGVASDNPRGLRVYEAAGMGPRFRFDVFERPIN